MKLFFSKLRLLDVFFTLLVIFKIVFFYIWTGASNDSIIIGLITFMAIGVAFYIFLFSNSKYSRRIFIGLYSGITVLMFLDSLYYCYFNQLLSINQLFQVDKLIVINDSFKFAAPPISIIILADIPFIAWYTGRIKRQLTHDNFYKVAIYKKIVLACLSALILICVINPFNANAVKAINHNEVITYHLYDIYTKVFGDKNNIIKSKEDVLKVIANNKEPETTVKKYTGIAKGRNLIVIQVESMQDFVIGRSYEGQVLTPNLNELIKDHTIYFDNYYTNIGKGNTADSEFATLNSIYPNIDGSCYENYPNNTYYGLPWILKEKGYRATAYHGYLADFWNREQAYKAEGFDDFISEEDFNVTTNIGFGMSDEEMFSETANLLEKEKQPFFSFIITLSCHYPYTMPEQYAGIKLLERDKGTIFGNYMQAVNYSDKAIGEFINELKEKGIYDNSIIAIYGDHYALNCKVEELHERMSEFLDYDYNYDEMMNIPLLINIPGEDVTSIQHISGGQVDFLPTIANIMGIQINNPYVFGRDLLNSKTGYTAFVTFLFRGSFLWNNIMFQYSEDDIYENSNAWDISTLKYVSIDDLRDENTRARNLVDASKYVLDNNLIER